MSQLDPQDVPFIDEYMLKHVSKRGEEVDNSDIVKHPSASFDPPKQDLLELRTKVRDRAIEKYRQAMKRIAYPNGYLWELPFEETSYGKGFLHPLKNLMWKKLYRRSFKKLTGGKCAKGLIPERPTNQKIRAKARGLFVTAHGLEARGLEARGLNARGGAILGTILSLAAPLAIKGLTELGKYIYKKIKNRKSKKSAPAPTPATTPATATATTSATTPATTQDLAAAKGAGEVPTKYQMEQASAAANKASKQGKLGFPNPLAFPKYPISGGRNSIDMFRDIFNTVRNMVGSIAEKAKIKPKIYIPFMDKFINRSAKNLLGRGAKKLLSGTRYSKPFKSPLTLKQIVEPFIPFDMDRPEEWFQWKRYLSGKSKTRPTTKEEPKEEPKSSRDKIKLTPRAKYIMSPEEKIKMIHKLLYSKPMNKSITGNGITDILANLISLIGNNAPGFIESLPVKDTISSLASFIADKASSIFQNIDRGTIKPILNSIAMAIARRRGNPDDVLRLLMNQERNIMEHPATAAEVESESEEDPEEYYDPMEEEGSGLIDKSMMGKRLAIGGAYGLETLGHLFNYIRPTAETAARSIAPTLGELGKAYAFKWLFTPKEKEMTPANMEQLKEQAALAKAMSEALQALGKSSEFSRDYVGELKGRMDRVRTGTAGAPYERTMRSNLERQFGISPGSDPYGTRLPGPMRSVIHMAEDPFSPRSERQKQTELAQDIGTRDIITRATRPFLPEARRIVPREITEPSTGVPNIEEIEEEPRRATREEPRRATREPKVESFIGLNPVTFRIFNRTPSYRMIDIISKNKKKLEENLNTLLNNPLHYMHLDNEEYDNLISDLKSDIAQFDELLKSKRDISEQITNMEPNMFNYSKNYARYNLFIPPELTGQGYKSEETSKTDSILEPISDRYVYGVGATTSDMFHNRKKASNILVFAKKMKAKT